MRLYEYSLMIDDTVVANGYLQASKEVVVEARLQKEVCPKYVWDRLTYKEVFCEICGDDNDVARYYIREEPYIKCNICRQEHVAAFVADVNRRALKILSKK